MSTDCLQGFISSSTTMSHRHVTFFKTNSRKARNGAVNFHASQELGLKSTDRLGFGYKGRVIYATKRSKLGMVQRAWNDLIGRTEIRRLAALTALDALYVRVLQLPDHPPEVRSQLANVHTQLANSASVQAADYQALIGTLDHLEKRHAEARAMLKFDTEVQTASRLLLQEVGELSGGFDTSTGSKDEDDPFDRLMDFIQQTTTSNLVLDEARPAYLQAQPFAAAWLGRPRQDAIQATRSELLLDALARLVLRGCESSPPRQQPQLPSFSWDGDALVSSDGMKRFLPANVGFADGGNGSVKAYRCDGEVVVVKTLHEHEGTLSRAEEAAAEARVHWQANPDGKSEHIVGIRGTASTQQGRVMLVLDYAPYGESTDLMRKFDSQDRETEDARMLMFADMLKAAAESHARGVMHLDLKPGNYFVGEGGKLLLGDFGTSRTELIGIDKGGVASVDYTAPELESLQHREGLITYKVDVWSLGVILYELNSPRQANDAFGTSALRPFPYSFSYEGRELLEQFAKTEDRSARFTQLKLDEGEPLHELIMKMLDPDPLNRPSLEEVLKDPLIQPYAKPTGEPQRDTVQKARESIRAQVEASAKMAD